MYYWTPKRLKELKAAGYKLHASPSSLVKKAISADDTSTDGQARTPKEQADPDSGVKPQAVKVSSSKRQAPSNKRQAASRKLQASE